MESGLSVCVRAKGRDGSTRTGDGDGGRIEGGCWLEDGGRVAGSAALGVGVEGRAWSDTVMREARGGGGGQVPWTCFSPSLSVVVSGPRGADVDPPLPLSHCLCGQYMGMWSDS